MEAKHKLGPCVGDYITGCCVTMNSRHDGAVIEIVGTHGWESTLRYRIKCDDGRERVVFHQGYAFRPASHTDQAARINAAAWATFDAL